MTFKQAQIRCAARRAGARVRQLLSGQVLTPAPGNAARIARKSPTGKPACWPVDQPQGPVRPRDAALLTATLAYSGSPQGRR